MHEDSTRKQRVASFVLFFFSLVYLYGCLGLKIGRTGNPGPGFMPLVVGILLVFFSGLGLVQTLRRRQASIPDAEGDSPTTAGILFPLGTAACVLLYPFLLKGLKFIPSTFLVMFVMLVMNRYKNLALNGLIALVIAVASFVFFSMILGVVLPMGKLEILIFQLR
jgi:putative tricarboxylic transport membrane protein